MVQLEGNFVYLKVSAREGDKVKMRVKMKK